MSEIRKIENFAAPELDVYARLSEPQLLHYYEPQPGLFLAESPRVIERALDAGYEPVSFLAGSAELAANEALFAHCPDAPVYTAETKVLEQLTGFALTRGMLWPRCTAARFRLWRKSAGMPAAWRFWKMS